MIAEMIDPAILGFILVGVMLFAIFIGFPISFTLIFLGFVFGYLGFGKLVFYLMTLQFSMVMTEQTLAAVPLFVFMGIMMEQAGLMERLFSAFQMMLAKVKGSLYYAVLFVSVIFAAATGIVGASVTILGIMAAKSMNRSGYDGTDTRCRTTLCLYGNYDGTSWFNGEIVFSISNDVGKS